MNVVLAAEGLHDRVIVDIGTQVRQEVGRDPSSAVVLYSVHDRIARYVRDAQAADPDRPVRVAATIELSITAGAAVSPAPAPISVPDPEPADHA